MVYINLWYNIYHFEQSVIYVYIYIGTSQRKEGAYNSGSCLKEKQSLHDHAKIMNIINNAMK